MRSVCRSFVKSFRHGTKAPPLRASDCEPLSTDVGSAFIPLSHEHPRLESGSIVDDDFLASLPSLSPRAGASLNESLPAIYTELRRLARHYMARERVGHTLQSTALVHEAYIRMVSQKKVDWCNRAQMLAISARMMRRVLLDHAAGRNAQKRGGDMIRITLTDDFAIAKSGCVDLIDLDRALQQLDGIDPQQATVVELRFFAGMNDDEIAKAVEVSPATVRRRWASAKLWLARRLAEAKHS